MESQKEQWSREAKKIILETGEKNILTRCQEFQKCINQATTDINMRLNLPTQNYESYPCPVQNINDCKKYLQWINQIKTPQAKTQDNEITTYVDMENQIRSRYNYLKPEYYGDELFPTLFQFAISEFLTSDYLINFLAEKMEYNRYLLIQ